MDMHNKNFSHQFRCLLIEVVPPSLNIHNLVDHFAELESLVTTYRAEVIDRIVQHRTAPHRGTYIGTGKVEEVQAYIKEHHIDRVILNTVTSAGIIFRLEKALWDINPQLRVWDRADLILEIFDQHASSREAKLQIALARLTHLGPRIYGLGGSYFSKQGGGIGTRGIGETNIELMRRHIKKHFQHIKKELSEIKIRRTRMMSERKHHHMNTIALVGYTNAGKTSLYNLLTGKQKEVKHALFTTLDSTTGKLTPQKTHKDNILITDTIGFIDRLPTFLIKAFESTLMESLHADLLIHVVDGSDPQVDKKIIIVEDILRQLGVSSPPLLVFNKLDAIPDSNVEILYEKYKIYNPHFISVKKNAGIQTLLSHLQKSTTKHPALLPNK